MKLLAGLVLGAFAGIAIGRRAQANAEDWRERHESRIAQACEARRHLWPVS